MDAILINLISTLIAFIIGLFLKDTILPFIQNSLLLNSKISGDWDYYYSKEEHAEKAGKIIFKQGRSDIIGIGEVWKTQRNEKVEKQVFLLKGKFASGKLVSIYQEKNHPNLIVGTITLVSNSHVNFLEGKTVYYSHTEKSIVVYDIFLKKV